jgi:hypothetical protein
MTLLGGYCIDTSAFVRIKERYPQEIIPVWDYLTDLAQQGRLIAPYQVLLELKKQSDEVSDWAEKNIMIFKYLNGKQQYISKDIINAFPRLVDPQKTSPADADPDVIALAQDENLTVLTDEKFLGMIPPKSKTRIPDVCDFYGVPWLNDYVELFKNENWRFIRAQS